MTTKNNQPDLVSEVEELLAKVPAWKLTAAEWGNEMRIGYFEHGSRFTVAKVHTFEGPDVDKSLAELFARSPDLLRRLVEEVKKSRDEVVSLRERERQQLSTVIEIRGCDKCDVCEDHQ